MSEDMVVPGFDAATREWSSHLLASGDPDMVAIGAAMATWVNCFRPERRLNQCLSAGLLVQALLDSVAVSAELVPVAVAIEDRQTGRLAVSASDRQWMPDGSWNGHCVLIVPSARKLIDPTLGQFLPDLPLAARLPLITDFERSQTDGGVVVGWRGGCVVSYKLLDRDELPGDESVDVRTVRDQLASSSIPQEFTQEVGPDLARLRRHL